MKSPLRVFVGLLMLLAVGAAFWAPGADVPIAPIRHHQDSWIGEDDLLTRALSPGTEPALLERAGLWPGMPAFQTDGAERPGPEVVPAGGADVRVNATDPPYLSNVQSETSIALNGSTGAICVTWNDIYHYSEGLGICGYSRSTDGGASWDDGGAMPPGPGNNTCRGDPSVVWRAADGYFYYASLDSGGPSNPNGIGLWRSTDDCASFQWYQTIQRSGGNEDKELLAIDNNPASPYYGRIYLAWLRLDTTLHYSAYSDDGGLNWSTPVVISDPAERPGGAFPVVAPNGDIYVGWAGWHDFPFGLVDQDIVRSADGGDTFVAVTPPAENTTPPRDPTAEAYCNFIAIRGFLRYLPSLQIAITPGASGNPDDYCLHVIYPYDPDGYGVGDSANVYYRRSCDYGQTWSPEVLLNDDGGLTDQFYPSLAANENGVVVVSWYDRRNDPENNYYFERWGTVSYDNGATWEPNSQIGDVATPAYIDTLTFCDHGDYDLMAADEDYAYIVWVDDRVYFNGHYDQDIWFDKLPLWPDFDLEAAAGAFDTCRPEAVTTTLGVGSIFFYDQPVILSDSGVPAGVNTSFSANPVTPEGASIYTVDVTADAAVGSYAWLVRGDSPTSTHGVTVTLVVNSAIPGSPTPTDPPDGAADLPQGHILFQWSEIPEATSYHLQVDNDPAFASPEADVSGIETNSYDLPGQLDPATVYHWRVRAANGCGESAFSSSRSFSTAVPCILLVDDDNDHPDMTAYYVDALNILGYAYDVFDVGGGVGNGPTLAEMENYAIVIWFSGDKVGGGAGPNPTDEANLAAYLDGGGNLFLSSQDYLHDFGWTSFGAAYLGIGGYGDDGADQRVMIGQSGDPIGSGQTYFPTYPPDFVERGDIVSPAAGTSVAFASRQGHNLALDKDGGAWRTVFFANSWVPLHFIEADPDAEVLGRILEWFGGCPDLQPAIVVEPLALEETLYADEQITQTLWISNVGNVDLTFLLAELSRTVVLYDIPWLSENPVSGTVAPDEGALIDITFDSAGLTPGLYLGLLDIASNDPIVPQVSVPVTLTVLPPCEPVTGTAFSWDPPVPELGQVVTFTAVATGSLPITFAWDFGDGSSGTGMSVPHTYDVAGDHVVVLTASNACHWEVVSHTIAIVVPPCEPVHDADFGWTPVTPTAGQVVTFTGWASGTPPITYTWNWGDGSLPLAPWPSATHTYDVPGEYTGVLTATNCATATATAVHTVTVTCEEVSIVTVTQAISGCVVTFGAELTGTAPYTLLWDFGPFGTSTETNPVVDFGATGTYTGTLGAWNCGGAGHDLQAFSALVECAPPGWRIFLPLVVRG